MLSKNPPHGGFFVYMCDILYLSFTHFVVDGSTHIKHLCWSFGPAHHKLWEHDKNKITSLKQ